MASPNYKNTVKILEQNEVSPPAGSVPATSLPLTFLDLPWILCCQIQRIYFYEFPHSTQYFLENLFPTLKHSLSLTLQHFFPFAATLISPPPQEKPYILFSEGDSVPLSVAESHADFNFLAARHPRQVEALHPLVPTLKPPCGERDKAHQVAGPLLALQVTVFPNSGMCIGVRFHHVAGDGTAFNHFMRSWALVCKNGGSDDRLTLPSHDRAVIKDPDGLEHNFLNQYWSCNRKNSNPAPHEGYVRATFVIGRAQIEKLKRCVITNDDSTSLRISSFVVTCALIWVCLINSEEEDEINSSVDEDTGEEPCNLGFAADCRDRVENMAIPTTYFGNCMVSCLLKVKRKELVKTSGEIQDGVVAAAKAIGKKVGEVLGSGVALRETENTIEKWTEIAKNSERLLTVAGSSKPGVYEADFGWGRLERMEMVHVEGPGAIYVAASKEEKGGIEVGLALSRDQMSRFSSILEESLLNTHIPFLD